MTRCILTGRWEHNDGSGQSAARRERKGGSGHRGRRREPAHGRSRQGVRSAVGPPAYLAQPGGVHCMYGGHRYRPCVVSGQRSEGQALLEARRWSEAVDIRVGGERRQDSVLLGLEGLQDTDWTVVHDGARPCIDVDTIIGGLAEARKTGAAVAAVRVKDTIKVAGADMVVTETLAARPAVGGADASGFSDRHPIRGAPAHFPGRHGRRRDGRADRPPGVDLHGLVRQRQGDHRGGPARCRDVPACPRAARAMKTPATPRSGLGFDVHPLVEGRALVLGGGTGAVREGAVGPQRR